MAGAIAAVVAIATVAVTVQFARRAVTPTKRLLEDIRLIAVGDDTVTLSSTADSRLPGRYSLWFGQRTGHAKIGDIIASTASTVTRKLLSVDAGELGEAKRVQLGGWFYRSPAELGLPFRNVYVQTSLGPAPAWVVPAASGRRKWLIAVHGRGVQRAECLRGVEAARRAGYTCLLISWRNDGEAPASSDGLYALGDSEWEDVDAALQYAIAGGAKDVVLMGWSMGGAIALQAVMRSPHASVVRGLVLDSPVVDWSAALSYHADKLGVPGALGMAMLAMISRPWGRLLTGQARSIDLDRLDFVARADELRLPMLLLHSDDDDYIPPAPSRALARARPDIVSYEAFAVARHTKLWNVDSERWNAAITSWLGELERRRAAQAAPKSRRRAETSGRRARSRRLTATG